MDKPLDKSDTTKYIFEAQQSLEWLLEDSKKGEDEIKVFYNNLKYDFFELPKKHLQSKLLHYTVFQNTPCCQ